MLQAPLDPLQASLLQPMCIQGLNYGFQKEAGTQWIAEESCRILAQASRAATKDLVVEHVHRAAQHACENIRLASSLPAVEQLSQQIEELQREARLGAERLLAAELRAQRFTDADQLLLREKSIRSLSGNFKYQSLQDQQCQTQPDMQALSPDHKALSDRRLTSGLEQLKTISRSTQSLEDHSRSMMNQNDLDEAKQDTASNPFVLEDRLQPGAEIAAELENANQFISRLKIELESEHDLTKLLQAEIYSLNSNQNISEAEISQLRIEVSRLQSELDAAIFQGEQQKSNAEHLKVLYDQSECTIARVTQTTEKAAEEHNQSLASVRQIAEDAKVERDQYKAQVKNMSTAVEERDQQIVNLRSEWENSRTTLEHLRKAVEERDQTIIGDKEKVYAAQSAQRQAERELSSLKASRRQDDQVEQEQLRATVENLRQEVQERDVTIISLKKNLEEARDVQNQLEEELSSLKALEREESSENKEEYWQDASATRASDILAALRAAPIGQEPTSMGPPMSAIPMSYDSSGDSYEMQGPNWEIKRATHEAEIEEAVHSAVIEADLTQDDDVVPGTSHVFVDLTEDQESPPLAAPPESTMIFADLSEMT